MTDDLPTVVSWLQRRASTVLVQVLDDRTEHIEYWDESTETVATAVLIEMQDSGFRVLDAGWKPCEVTGRKQAWAAFRRHEPFEVFGNSTGDSSSGGEE
jgi:hypothetical protein